MYLDGTPLESSKDTLVHENVFYLLRSNVTDAVVYLFWGQLKKICHNVVTVNILCKNDRCRQTNKQVDCF